MGAVDHLLVSEDFEKMPNVEPGTVKRLGDIAEKSKATVTIISLKRNFFCCNSIFYYTIWFMYMSTAFEPTFT